MSIFARASRRAPALVPLVPPLPGPPPSAPLPPQEARRDEGRLSVLGRSAWYLLGLTLVAALALWIVARLAVVTVPVVLALLPAAALVPLVNRLKRWRLRPALAASVVLIGLLALLPAGSCWCRPSTGW